MSKKTKQETSTIKDGDKKKSLLPKDVKDELKQGMEDGFEDGWLSLDSNEIYDSMIPEICEWLIKLEGKVNTLNLDENQITSQGVCTLFDILKGANLSIKDVGLSENQQVDDKCMKSLGEYIKSNKSIETIWLNSTNVSDAGIEILVPYLDGNTTFERLYLMSNKGITDKSFPLLMKMIESSCIEYIDINDTSIAQKNAIYMFLACNNIRNGLTELKLTGNGLNDDDLIKICDAMKKYGIDKLQAIRLSQNKLTSKGASVLFDTLKECNSAVSDLALSYNKLDDECMKQIGEYLQDNERIKILTLSKNDITDKGVEMLSEYLIGNTTLKKLDLGDCKRITDASVPYLLEIAKGSFFNEIVIRSTSITDDMQREIKEALKKPIEEREIPIKSNTKSAAKISSISAASAST